MQLLVRLGIGTRSFRVVDGEGVLSVHTKETKMNSDSVLRDPRTKATYKALPSEGWTVSPTYSRLWNRDPVRIRQGDLILFRQKFVPFGVKLEREAEFVSEDFIWGRVLGEALTAGDGSTLTNHLCVLALQESGEFCFIRFISKGDVVVSRSLDQAKLMHWFFSEEVGLRDLPVILKMLNQGTLNERHFEHEWGYNYEDDLDD